MTNEHPIELKIEEYAEYIDNNVPMDEVITHRKKLTGNHGYQII